MLLFFSFSLSTGDHVCHSGRKLLWAVDMMEGSGYCKMDHAINADVAVSALLPLVDMQEHGVSILGFCLRSITLSPYRVHTTEYVQHL